MAPESTFRVMGPGEGCMQFSMLCLEEVTSKWAMIKKHENSQLNIKWSKNKFLALPLVCVFFCSEKSF